MKRTLLGGLLMLAGAPLAHAFTYCVATASQLEFALADGHAKSLIDSGAEIDVRIQRSAQEYVVQAIPASGDATPFGNLSIRGGYAPGCSELNREVDATNTLVWLGKHSPFTVNSWRLQGLTVRGSRTLSVARAPEGSGGIELESNVFEVENLAFLSNGSTPVTYRLVNNVIGNPTSDDACAVTIRNFRSDLVDTAIIANNTIVGAAKAAVCFDELASARFDNNLFWGNARGIEDEDPEVPTPVVLVHNLLQPENIIPGQQGAHLGALSVDPQFEPGSFRPALNSAVVNSGSPGSVPGGLPESDVEGSARVVGSRVDRGAYESPVADVDGYVVNTAADTVDMSNGTLSLRSALALANADPGFETISFDIASPLQCEAKIQLDPQLGPLPPVTGSVLIDGYTQPTARRNTAVSESNANLCIAVVGNQEFSGLEVPANAQATLTVRGLRFENFNTAIRLRSGTGHTIEGNAFNQAQGGSSQFGVIVQDGASNVFIGGYDVAKRNYFGGAQSAAISLLTNGNFVSGNWFARDEVANATNQRAVRIFGNFNRVDRNDIFDSSIAAVTVQGNGNTIAENVILENASGILFESPASGSNTGNLVYSNDLYANQGPAIAVPDHVFGTKIWANRIHDNAGLGIDLSPLGQANANDTDSVTLSPRGNRSINHPVLLAAQNLAGDPPTRAQVLGTFASANGDYTLRFYANATCTGREGAEPVGSVNVKVSNGSQFANGSAGFSVPVNSASPIAGRGLVATATDTSGNTSEFGACLIVAGTPPDPDPEPLPDGIFADGFEDPAI